METAVVARGELAVIDHTGDTKVMWDPNVQVEVDVAKGTFDKMRKNGYLAYSVAPDGKQAEQINEFDKAAGKIIMTPPLRGG
jgi:hypothetical protein